MKKGFKWLSGIALAVTAMAVLPMTAHAAGKDMYCLYNSANKEFLYTIDENEKNNLLSTWEYKGVICTLPDSSSTPVYRLYDPTSTQHLYTSDDAEINKLVGEGWKKEGVAYFVDDSHTAPVYRMFNPATGEHQFSGSAAHMSSLEAIGWVKEGVAYYALSVNEKIGGTEANIISSDNTTVVNSVVDDGSSVWGTYNGVDITRKNMYSVFKKNGWINNEYWITDKTNARYPGVTVTLINGQDGCYYYEIESPFGTTVDGLSWNGAKLGMTREEIETLGKFSISDGGYLMMTHYHQGTATGRYQIKYDSKDKNATCGNITLGFSDIAGKSVLTGVLVDFDYRSN